MRLNEKEAVMGVNCILVPYCRKHVEKYHEWMKRKELLEATCSEPLTFEEELEMQRSWREDPDKLTFIVLDRNAFEKSNGNEVCLHGMEAR